MFARSPRYSPRFRAFLFLLALSIGLSASACGPGAPEPRPVVTATIAGTPLTVVQTASPDSGAGQRTPTSGPSFASATPTPTVAASPTRLETATPSVEPTAATLTYEWHRAALTGTELTHLALLPGGKNVVLASGPKGVWRSEYPYAGWEELGPKLVGRTTLAEIASPELLYVTSNTGCASGLPSARYRSIDGGKTWAPMDNEAMTIAAANITTAYATTCTNIIKTTDSGATWVPVTKRTLKDSYDPTSLVASPDGQNVYATYLSEGGSGAIFASTDAGSTWLDISPTTEPDHPLQAPTNLIYQTGTQGRPQDAGLYMTSYEGVWFLPAETTSWKLLNKPQMPGAQEQPYSWFTTLFLDTSDAEGYNKPGPLIYTARAMPAEGGTESLGVFRSGDGGRSWASLIRGLDKRVVTGLVLAPASQGGASADTLLAATGDGIWSVTLPPPFK